ncbi:hypothetical protein Pan241w_58350 [Gimesia alba]|uniref:Uncharacterized protein n=1 Tax=Gimesia alba TaxID=2527973 RepID=A0A517RPA2_9PLAN|nr:hypothetical protein [Gimesia alba]QDT45708.1 hypothetical protein Pan241w_58350 [Gimesia alba]
MAAVTKNYRVDGRDDYTLTYQKKWNGTYEIHCSRHPHNPQSRSMNDCHLGSDGKVCVASGKEPRSLDKAKAIGMAFAEGYSHYVRTGIFPNGAKRVNV